MKENERLKELRKEKKMTQKEFSESIGISRTYYSNIENGTMPLTPQIIDMICFKFKVSKEWILNGSNNAEDSKINNQSFLVDKYNDFMKIMDKLALEATEDEFELIVSCFSYFVSILTNYKKINSKELLINITEFYDKLEKYCFAQSTHRPKSNNYEDLYHLKLNEEQIINDINSFIRKITSLFIK